MDAAAIRALYDREQRFEVEQPGMKREVAGPVVRQIDLSGRGSCIIHSSLENQNVENTIRDQIGYFESIGRDFEWKVYSHDRPPDLKEQLAVHGFEVEETEAIMALDLTTLPALLLQPTNHDIRRITDPSGIADVIAVKEQVLGDSFDGLGTRLANDLRNVPEQLSVYVGYAADTPVSSAWIYFHPKSQFASLWGGSTLPEYRKRGYYTALVAARSREAKQRGARFLTIDAQPMSRPIAEKIGFQLLCFANACNWKV